MKEKKDRVDDAMHATKAAVEEGIVPGGGVALLRAKTAVGKLTSDNADVKAGIAIVLRALEAPIRQIVENAGVEGSIVVGKILDNKSETYGFNAQTEEYVDMLQAGIVDPAKVVRYGPSGRSFGRRSFDHHRGHGGRRSEQGSSSRNARRWRHGWNGRHGLLTPAAHSNTLQQRPWSDPGPFHKTTALNF